MAFTCATGKHRRPSRMKRTTARAAGIAALTTTGVVGTVSVPALAADISVEDTGLIPVVTIGDSVAERIDEQATAQKEAARHKAAEEAARKKAAEAAAAKKAAEKAAAQKAAAKAAAKAPAPAAAPAPASSGSGSFQGYALSKLGGDGGQFSCLENLWGKESGWNPNAQNPGSTAYGIPQFLDSTWASTGIAKTSDGYRQIDAGLIYIDSRYGSPCGAWGHSQSTGWY